MRNSLYLIPFVLFMSACNQKEKSKPETLEQSSNKTMDDMVEEKTTQPVIVLQSFPEELNNRITDFDTLRLPLHLKHGELEDHQASKELDRKQFNFLSQNFNKAGVEDYIYIQDANEMYDLKDKGEYETYVAHLDLAQLRDATAHPYGQINLDTAIVLLWTINYSSFEACPFYSGTDLYASVVQDNTVQTTVFLGNEGSGGDPPAFGETLLELKVSELLTTDRTTTNKTYEDEELLESHEHSTNSSIIW